MARIFMKLKVIVGIIIVVVAFAILAGVKAAQIGKLVELGKNFQLPPETVSSAVVHEEKWRNTMPAVGSISAVEGITLSAEIAGKVTEISFESGAKVAKDDLLVRFDTVSEEAQLRALQAKVEWAQTNLARIKSLRTENTLSQAELDQAETELKQNQANADTVRAMIAKRTIRAPFAGQLGIRQVNIGQFLDIGKPIVSLQSLSPLYADTTLPQQVLAKLTTGLAVRVSADTYPGKFFDGVLTAINPDLDPVSRTVRVQATIQNTEHLLRPGMFARIEFLFPEEQTVLVVPATSILPAAYGDSVYVIEEKPASTNSPAGLVVRQKFVKLGRAKGDFVTVVSGLKSGEKVVSSGMFKLRNGMSVVENNEISPKSDKKPNPSDS
ncbi:MAG: efflux RND transporter periplasmic adaptor subunit [Verrucomicrobia bacterium]|nr:efflux RND transporter periplasmic adaptor subunit [Verrucomicrobiota bacterium]